MPASCRQAHAIETFAQALRAIGEPIFGRTARDVSMARLLQQLFDTTRRFDMELQPQLVLLQKTMVVVEGVARSLDPDFDIWEAARPVIEGWMIEQVGPEARLRDAAEGIGALGRLAQNLPDLLEERGSRVRDAGGRRDAASSRHGARDRAGASATDAPRARCNLDRGGGSRTACAWDALARRRCACGRHRNSASPSPFTT